MSQRVECIIPILSVKDVPASVRFYSNVLGFHLDWGEGENSEYASVSRDGHAIMLSQAGQGKPGTWVWIGIEDVVSFYEQCKARGAVIVEELTNYPWAYEMRVADPDGHILRFGSETRTDLPVVNV